MLNVRREDRGDSRPEETERRHESHCGPHEGRDRFMVVATETTAQVIDHRRLSALGALAGALVSATTIESVAEASGFSNEEQMRCSFIRILGIPQREYRKRFATTV